MLQTDLGFARLNNPIMPASGCFGWGREYIELFDLKTLGAVVTKATTYLPREGNATPRVAEAPAGMLNAIGLQNAGLHAVVKTDLPWLLEQKLPVLVNVAGSTVEEYVQVAAGLAEFPLLGLELNLSCPNVREGGIAFGLQAESVHRVVQAVKAECQLPLVVKLSPNVTEITELAVAAAEAGASALTVINTLRGMAIDIEHRRPLLANTFGGLSGPAIKPVALAMVWQVASAVDIPVIGCGGISRVEDVVEFLMAGASAVQVGSASFSEPLLLPRLVWELEAWLQEHQTSVTELVGAAQRKDEIND